MGVACTSIASAKLLPGTSYLVYTRYVRVVGWWGELEIQQFQQQATILLVHTVNRECHTSYSVPECSALYCL